MPFDRDKLFEQFKEMGANAKQPTCPDVLNIWRMLLSALNATTEAKQTLYLLFGKTMVMGKI